MIRKRDNPVIHEMRLSDVRKLVSRLSSVHGEFPHRGWSSCECELAKILRETTNIIRKHLKLPLEKV